jgi:hypothetical protein
LNNSLSENNLLANFKKISKEINENNNLSLLMRKTCSDHDHSNEIVLSNTGGDEDDNYDNFFIAIAESSNQNGSGLFQVKEVLTD